MPKLSNINQGALGLVRCLPVNVFSPRVLSACAPVSLMMCLCYYTRTPDPQYYRHTLLPILIS